MEAGPAESTGSSSIGAVAQSEEPKLEVQKPNEEQLEPDEEPKPDFKCRRCTKAFHSGPALCGHQNAHRPLTDPSRISPVLAAVLNNPLPGDKPDLIPINPGANKEKLVPKQKRQQPATAAGNESPRYHPYKKLGKDKEQQPPIQNQAINLMIEETGSSDHIPNEKPVAEGEDLLGEQLIQNDADAQPIYHYHPFEREEPQPEPQPVYTTEQHPRPKRVTLDLLGEWAPLSAFGGELGTSYWKNSVGDAALGMGSRRTRSSAPLDLELKLGFGPGF